MRFLRNTLTLFGRSMRHIMRSPDTIITVAIVPIGMMLMFVYVFGGAMRAGMGDDVNYVNFQLPGILILTIVSGITYVTMRIFMDKQTGMMARLNSMPISRASVLWAHVLTSVVSNAIAIAFVLLAAFVMGFRPDAGILGWLAAGGILLMFTLAMTWVAMLPGLMAKSVEGASAFAYPLMFLVLLSSAFAPTDTMPTALRVFAENQPATAIIETIRNLLGAQPVGNEVWVALLWCAGIMVAAYWLAVRRFKRV